jgi:hypothetical protein
MQRSTARETLSCIFVLMFAIGSGALAGEVQLGWNPSENAAGYRAYRGTDPDQLGVFTDVGDATSTTVDGLDDCVTWYFAVSAYNVAGESEFSAPTASFPRAVLGAANPATVERGSQTTVVLSGVNFRPGDGVNLSHPAIQLDGLAVDSCNQLTLTVSVASNAPLGSSDVSVVHPSGVSGSTTGLLTIVEDATPPEIANVTVTDVAATTALVTWSTNESADSRVFFRKQGNQLYRTLEASDLTMEHSVSLYGLEPQTTYEYHVGSTDAAGRTGTSPDETFTTTASPYDYLRLEAETGDLSGSIEVESGSDAFAGAWIETTDSSAGSATYGVQLPSSGSWRVWLRVRGDAGSDVWSESIDGAAPQPVSPDVEGQWDWVAGRVYTLDAGHHTVTLDGLDPDVRADRLLLTDDPDFVPGEEPDVDVTPPAAATDLVAVGAGSQIQLSWLNPSDVDLDRVVVRVRDDGSFPSNPADGFPLADMQVAPGSAGSRVHSDVAPGVTYHYAVFAIDETGNAAPAALALGAAIAAPAPPTGVNVH